MKRARAALAHPVVPMGDVFVREALGSTLVDVDGNRHIDLTGGSGTQLVGYNHPHVVTAVVAQARSLLHSDFSEVPHEPYVAARAAIIAH
jgi:4-aminobutyrate aminotransferase/(S)-3-amino-2-methylpropionate transaminase